MTDMLPAADWTRRDDLAALVAALGPGNLRWVGGAVRDTLLGEDVSDIDGATPLPPQEVTDRCKSAEISTVPTGIDHGTVTAILPGGPVEITTLRHDVSTDGRRATVSFATDWKDDAARRDFTMNALYADPETLELFDYFGGLEDLQGGQVRFIGDARERIREDHLRILRYYRFQARFGSLLDGEAEEACVDLAPTLKGLSRERVASELLKLLALPDPHETVSRMFRRGVLPVVLPEASAEQVGTLARLIATEQGQQQRPSAMRRLSALLPPNAELAGQVASRLRLSSAQKKRLQLAARRSEADAATPRALAYRLGLEGALDRLLILAADTSDLKGWEIPRLPIKGGEIVAKGVVAGPEVARILCTIEDSWIAEGFPDRARVMEMLDQLIAN